MKNLKEVAHAFLKLKSITVVGISSKGDAAANIIYKRLRDQNYRVLAVNPNADVVEGDICYPKLQVIPEWVEGVGDLRDGFVAVSLLQDRLNDVVTVRFSIGLIQIVKSSIRNLKNR